MEGSVFSEDMLEPPTKWSELHWLLVTRQMSESLQYLRGVPALHINKHLAPMELRHHDLIAEQKPTGVSQVSEEPWFEPVGWYLMLQKNVFEPTPKRRDKK